MLVGHFAVGLLAKRAEPQISLGTAVLAAMLADFLWCLFMMAGVEQVQLRPGIGAANYWHPTNIAVSHSLLTDAIWGALFAGAFVFLRRRPRGAWFLFAAVLSHWLLDFVSHRPDMPLLPGVPRYFGLGLWTSIPLTLVVEGGIWLLALVLYARATRPARRTGTYAFWSVVILLTLAWYNNIAGPPPPNPQTAPIASLVFFSLVVAWGYWMNRLRPSAP
jgi:LexA-binding, inner membrane-associated putative hydrolase